MSKRVSSFSMWVSWLSSFGAVVVIPLKLQELAQIPTWVWNLSLGLIALGPLATAIKFGSSRVRDLVSKERSHCNLVGALSDLLRKSEILRKRTEVQILLRYLTGETPISEFVTCTTTDLLRELSNGLCRAHGGGLRATALLIRFSASHSDESPLGPLVPLYDFEDRCTERRTSESIYLDSPDGTLAHHVLVRGVPLVFGTLQEVNGHHVAGRWKEMDNFIQSGVLVPVIQNGVQTCVLQVDSPDHSAFNQADVAFIKCTADAVGIVHQIAQLLGGALHLNEAVHKKAAAAQLVFDSKTQVFEQQVAALTKKLRDANDHENQLESACATYHTEIAQLTREIKDLNDQLSEKRGEIKALKSELRKVRQEFKAN